MSHSSVRQLKNFHKGQRQVDDLERVLKQKGAFSIIEERSSGSAMFSDASQRLVLSNTEFWFKDNLSTFSIRFGR